MVETKKRDLPVWLGIALIAISAVGAGWFIWNHVSGFWAGPSEVFKIEGVDPTAPRSTPRRTVRAEAAPASNIREVNKTQWRLRTSSYSLDVKQVDGKLNLTMNISSMKVLPADAQWVAISRSRLDAESGQQLGLSSQQVRQFKTLPTNIRHEIKLTPDQTQQLQAAFQKYLDAVAAGKPAAERELTTLASRISSEGTAELTKKLRARYDEFTQSVTPEQWAKLKQLPPKTAAAAD